MTHKITTTWKGGMLFDSDNPSNHHVLMDTITRKELQYHQKYDVISLAGCSGLDVVSILENES